jgi:MATE family multidrug resistance protein
MTFDFKKFIPHYGALIRLGTPLIIGQIGIIIQNFADTLMIGHHSTPELAAAALVSNIFILGVLMAMGFALGLTPVIGSLYGREKTEEIGTTVKNGLVLNSMAALVLMMIYTVLYFFLDKLGQPKELLVYIRPYYIVNLISIPFVCWFNSLKQTFDATTDTSIPMWILVIGNVQNIVGNWLLIYGVGGCPEMGLLGAGISTLAARIVMFVLIVAAFLWIGRYRDIRRAFRRSRVSLSEVTVLFAMGWPICLQMGMESGAWSLCSIIVGWIGTNALAGHQIMLTVSQLFFQVYYALASAVSIRVSLFHGQQDYHAIHLTTWAGVHLNFMIAVLVSVPIMLCRHEIGFLFTDNREVTELVSGAIIPLIIYQFSDGLQCSFSNALRGLGDVKPLMKVAFISYFVVSLPVAYGLGISCKHGLVGVWYSFPVGLTIAGALYYWYYRRRFLLLTSIR